MADDKIVKFPPPPNAAAMGKTPTPIPVNLPEIGNLGFTDMEAAFNMRAWLERAAALRAAR